MNDIAWLGKPEERIINIRKFREHINTLSFQEAVKLTIDNWFSAPKLNKNQFDLSNIDDWPTPWNLFGQQTFCINAQTLGVFYTLILSDHIKYHDIKIAIVDDIITGYKPAIILDNYKVPKEYKIIVCFDKNDVKKKLGEE